jgi:hypothetical protein
MLEFVSTPAARAVIQVAVALIMSIVAYYVLERWRDRTSKEDTTSDHLTNFRDLRQRGVLSDVEFRTIKTVLGDRIREQLEQSGESEKAD